MSDEEHTEDELAMRRRLAAAGRDGSQLAAVPVAKVAKNAPDVSRFKPTTHICRGCGVSVATIRTVHVECQDCEGTRNRNAHERIREAIQAYKQRRDQPTFKRVSELCGLSHANALKQALEAKGSAPTRARKDDY